MDIVHDKTLTFSRRVVVFANGPVPPAPFVKSFIDPDDLIVCADGGANRIAGYGILPDAIVGDFDSVSLETLELFTDARIVRIPDQETNDLYKALVFAEGKGVEEAIVFGATGARHDQFLANLSLLKEFHHRMEIQYIDEISVIVLISERFELHGANGKTFSLWPLTERAEGVTTEGLKYPLDNETLFQDSRGLSNECAGDTAVVTLTDGLLIAIFQHTGEQ